MKVVRLHGPGELRVSEEPVPEYGPAEVLLRIRAVGICASDVHYYKDGGIGDAVVRDPLVLGHEVGAEVAEVGSDVTFLRTGDRVAVEPSNPCGECDVCLRGLINLCPNVKFFGTPPVDGALREYVAWPEHLCIPIPPSLSFADAAMTEPMAVGIYAADLAGLRGGETVVVLGAGAIGLSVIQAARVAGAGTIRVVDPIQGRCDLARQLGADEAIVTDSAGAVDQIWEDTKRLGPDLVFECAGENDAVRDAVRMASYDGYVIVAGIPYPDEVSFTASVARRKNLRLIFVRRSRNAVERAIEWAAERRIDLSAYVTHRFPLEDTGAALDLARDRGDGVIRAMVEM